MEHHEINVNPGRNIPILSWLLNRLKIIAKVIFSIVAILIVLYFLYPWARNPVFKPCSVHKEISPLDLQADLDVFYTGTTLAYSHRETKVKEIPEECFKNLIILTSGNRLSLKLYMREKADNFTREHELHNKVPMVTKRHKLMPLNITNLDYQDMRYTEDINQEKLVAQLELLKVTSDENLEKFKPLQDLLNSKTTEFNVPNLIHYIWFGNHTYRVVDYICMLSALRKQNPGLILVHGDFEPVGVYWGWLKEEAAEKLKFVRKSPPETIFGKKLTKVEHKSDVARLQILLQFGGIYLDTDTMVLQSLEELRKKDKLVLGRFTENLVANAIIVANRDSWFLQKWFYEYRNFYDAERSDVTSINVGLSMVVPRILSQLYPDQIHIEETRLMRPNDKETSYFFEGLIDMKDHLTVHMNMRWAGKDSDRTIAELAILNTTFGEVSRLALWNDTVIKDLSPWVLHPQFNKTHVVYV